MWHKKFVRNDYWKSEQVKARVMCMYCLFKVKYNKYSDKKYNSSVKCDLAQMKTEKQPVNHGIHFWFHRIWYERPKVNGIVRLLFSSLWISTKLISLKNKAHQKLDRLLITEVKNIFPYFFAWSRTEDRTCWVFRLSLSPVCAIDSQCRLVCGTAPVKVTVKQPNWFDLQIHHGGSE